MTQFAPGIRTVSRVLLLGCCLTIVSLSVAIEHSLAQTQDTVNERLRSAVEYNSHEIDRLRQMQIDSRLKALEDTVVEVKWLGRTAAGILLGQLLLGILTNRKKAAL